MADIAAAVSSSIACDGQTTITANLPMAGFRHTGVGDPVSAQDAATKNYVDTVAAPTGLRSSFLGTIAQIPTGWVALRGNSIGDGSSGGTERANADTVNLFTLLWANTNLTLQTSAGATTSRGASAAADYAAHCRLVLPNYNSNFAQFTSSTAATATGATGGSTSISGGTTTGSLSVSASQSPVVSGPNNGNAAGVQGGTSFNATLDGHTHNSNISVTGSTSGSLGVTGTVTPPYVTEIAIIKL